MSKTITGSELAHSVAGAVFVETSAEGVHPWRLSPDARRYATPALSLMSEFGAGTRLRLLTSASRLELDVSVTLLLQTGKTNPDRPAPFVAVVDGAVVDRVEITEAALMRETPEKTYRRDEPVRTSFVLELGASADDDRLVEVWLPHDGGTLIHSVSADAEIMAAPEPSAPRWLHYGSSISHGGSADGPLGTWPRLAAAALGLENVNLGFGGNAMLDASVARDIARTAAEVITLKIGINIVGGDAMRRRTFIPAVHGFLDTIREGHPDTPIVVITAIGCPAVEDVPGPARAGADGRVAATPREVRPGDGTLTLAITRTLLEEIVEDRARDDPALFLLDGLGLLNLEEALQMPDGLHPDQAGYDLMASRFAGFASDTSTGVGRAFEQVLAKTAA